MPPLIRKTSTSYYQEPLEVESQCVVQQLPQHPALIQDLVSEGFLTVYLIFITLIFRGFACNIHVKIKISGLCW